ncbi:MAG: pyruvoyl-dependent arginine decarboxylase [Candidatus Micrarchaeia archaeon]
MSVLIPRKVFFVKGSGVAKMQLLSFELALREAGIQRYNLVPVSSILPPGCEIIPAKEGLELLPSGSILFLVLSKAYTNTYMQRINSVVGCAVSNDKKQYGYLSEYESTNEAESTAIEKAEAMAFSMLSSISDKKLSLESTTKKEAKKSKSSKFVTTSSISSSIILKEKNKWACTVSAACFIV